MSQIIDSTVCSVWIFSLSDIQQWQKIMLPFSLLFYENIYFASKFFFSSRELYQQFYESLWNNFWNKDNFNVHCLHHTLLISYNSPVNSGWHSAIDLKADVKPRSAFFCRPIFCPRYTSALVIYCMGFPSR